MGILPIGSSAVAGPPDLYTTGQSFDLNSHIVSTSVFHWYTSTEGQQTGPWRPLEGRAAWRGTPSFWQGQIKQIMAANIDVMNVHLIPSFEAQRINLLMALGQMRATGYDVPKVVPFLDPMITWHQRPSIDLAAAAGKDELADQYIRFYDQYFRVNRDAFAESYLARIDGRTVLDTWHTKFNMNHLTALTRDDLQSRLAAALADEHESFNADIYMITTAANPPTFAFADEKVYQFEVHAYYAERDFNNIRTVQLKAGYWDQNIRTPGTILPRNGGVHYTDAWRRVDRNRIDRIYIESWNEYDEGSGIYAADPGPPYIEPGSNNPSSDVWSDAGDPYAHIKTTAEGARQFNDRPDYDARILWHDFPATLKPGETTTAHLIVRNEGDFSWTGAADFKLGQQEWRDPVLFGPGRYPIDDTTNEIPIYGGIFRGRPLAFDVQITAPDTPGRYTTHWGMLREHVTWFGDTVAVTMIVVPEPSILGDVNLDGLVNGLDVDPFVDVLLSGPYQVEADMNNDHVVNGLDVDPFVAAVVDGGTQPIPEPATLLLAFVALGVVGFIYSHPNVTGGSTCLYSAVYRSYS
jgi:hypothetical protein